METNFISTNSEGHNTDEFKSAFGVKYCLFVYSEQVMLIDQSITKAD